jgi:hypothetical protein
MRPISRRGWDRLPILVAVLVLSACAPGSDAGTTTTASTTVRDSSDEVTTSSTTPTSTSAPVAEAEPPCEAGSEPFVESGGAGLIERDDTDAAIVSGVRWASYPTCVRVVIEFAASSGAPAVLPPGVGPLFIRPAGVLRLQLDPAVSRSSFLDQVVDTDLVEAAYVVRRTTGDLFVDLHLGDPGMVRVSVASGPARVVVDVLAGGEAYRSPAVITEDLVVIDPVGDSAIYPFTVNGYMRGDAETMTVAIEAAGTEEILDGEIGERSDAWGAFTVLVPDGPDGSATMIVGGRIPISLELS